MHFKHEMIGLLPNIPSNFELNGTSKLTVFELTVPDLYVPACGGQMLRRHLSHF